MIESKKEKIYITLVQSLAQSKYITNTGYYYKLCSICGALSGSMLSIRVRCTTEWSRLHAFYSSFIMQTMI